MRIALVVAAVFLMMSQAHKTEQKPAKRTIAFSCPDDKAATACASFAENKEELNFNEFACFREGPDQYVKVAMNLQPTPWTWDPETKSATQDNLIAAWVMDHGLENPRHSPGVASFGTWRTNFLGGYNFSEKEGKVTASYGTTGMTLREVYKNTQDKEVTYELTIAGDTKRFRESWHLPDNVVDEQFGRCVAGPAQWPDYAAITKGPK
jgi:hypothetical protein